MPYLKYIEKLRKGDASNEIYIAIQPFNIDDDNNDKIQKIIEKYLNKFQVDVKYFPHTKSSIEQHNETGLQQGKEIVIICGNALLKENEFKKALLDIMEEFVKQGIIFRPLPSPNCKQVLSPAGLPTPFSYKLEKPGSQPKIFTFSLEELNQTDFKCDASIFDDTIGFLQTQNCELENEITEIKNQLNEAVNYEDLILSDSLFNSLWQEATEFQKNMMAKVSDSDNENDFKTDQFYRDMKKDPRFSSLFNHYPLTQNMTNVISNWYIFLRSIITNIHQGKNHFDEKVAHHRERYQSIMKELYSQSSAPEYKTNLEKSPRLAQTLDSRQKQIKTNNQFIKDLKKQQQKFRDTEQMFKNAIKGIDTYLARPRGFHSHLGFFSWMFDKDRGKHRAQAYKNALNNPEYPLNYKLKILFALFDSKDGMTLQKDVAQEVCNHQDLQAARTTIRNLAAKFNGLTNNLLDLGEDFNKDIDQIIAQANYATESTVIHLSSPKN